ncbi:MAG: hypothetical protein WDA60_03230 [Acidimicrobiia bacterium]
MTTGTELDDARPAAPVVGVPGAVDPPAVESRAGWRRRLPKSGWWWQLDDWLGLVILVACCVFVFVQLQPHLILRNTTPNGGDLGAHVWWPAYLRDHLLPWRLAGWSPDFYGGFPAGQFYFPVPALGIVGLDLFIPYNIAFKVVVAIGPMLVPAGAYVFAKGLRAPNPTPAAFAVAVTSFLFFTGDPGTTDAAKAIAFNQRIMGGNLASTLAGEFSFTLAIAFALFFFGTLAMALRTRRHLWLPALLLALCLMSHLMVGIFAVIGAVSVWLFHKPVKNIGRAAAIGGVGVLISAVWLVPLMVTMKYTTNMRYGPIGVDAPAGQRYTDYLFPKYFFEPSGWPPYQWGAYVLIAIGLVAGAAMLRRSTFVVLTMTVLCGLAFRFWTGLGTHVWNLRLVSFWYFGVHLLMAIGVAELIRGTGWVAGYGWRRLGERRVDADASEDAFEADPIDLDLDLDLGADRGAAWAGVGPPPPSVPTPAAAVRPGPSAGERGAALVVVLALTAVLAVGALIGIDDSKAFLPYWAKWNFSGYENVRDQIDGTYTAPCTGQGSVEQSLPVGEGETPLCEYQRTVAIGKQWPEYRALLDQLEQLPPGRSLWEGGPSLDKYGTPLALMLIPYWTKGRITTMEGVYFEASATTPYHFEAVAALVASGENANPVRGVPYKDQQSFDEGVRYLQALGINYFIAHNPTTKAKAGADPRLTLVATSPDIDVAPPEGWSIYRVADAPLVEGLSYEPVVAEGVAPDPDGWEQQIAAPWWWFPDQLDKPVVADGPASWRRAEGSAALVTPRRSIRPVTVTDVKADDDSISFRVDRTGVPVLVKTSYFPNWQVSGAEGPYRATPNFMVVVPTEKQVTLHYGTTRAEWLGRFLTLVGLVGLGALVWWGRRGRRGSVAAAAMAAPPLAVGSAPPPPPAPSPGPPGDPAGTMPGPPPV